MLWGAMIGLLGIFPLAASPHKSQRSLKPATHPVVVRLTADMIGEAEQRLSELGYWIGPPDRVFSAQDRQALIAFQKVQTRKRTGRLSLEDLKALRSATRPGPVEAGYPHIEVDLSKQVLYVVGAGGDVSHIIPVSTGSGKFFTLKGRREHAVTPTGKFTVYRKVRGWRKSPLGLLYFPNYIVGGIAIHGNPSVPVSPASHGCIRIPMFAAEDFSKMAPVGTVVIVHDSGRY
jgi:lipoprotein-anchoring transpeptidase ErfK/SrfK